MPSDHEFRLQFRQWLIRHDLDPEVADAILESMPPYDWSEIVRRTEIDALRRDMNDRFGDVDRRFEQVDQRFEQVDQRFDQVDRRFIEIDRRFSEADRRFDLVDGRLARIETDLRSFASDFHTMSRVVVFAVAAMAVTLAVFAIRVGLQVSA